MLYLRCEVKFIKIDIVNQYILALIFQNAEVLILSAYLSLIPFTTDSLLMKWQVVVQFYSNEKNDLIHFYQYCKTAQTGCHFRSVEIIGERLRYFNSALVLF